MLALVLLIAIAGGVVEYVRRGDIPRNLVRDAIADRTGLDVTIDSLEIGWSGKTNVAGVRFALPDESQPFLNDADIHLDHTALLMLVLTRELHLDSLLIENAKLTIEQDDDGQWNLQRAATLFEQNTPPSEKDDSSRTTLPEISVPDLVVRIRTRDGLESVISPVVLTGDQRGTTWHFNADIANLGTLAIEMEPDAENLTHVVRFDIDRPEQNDPLATWLPDDLRPLQLHGTWRGELADKGVTGDLELRSVRVRTASVNGATRVTTEGAVVTIAPTRLNLRDEALARPVRLVGGEVRFDAPLVDMNNLRAQFSTGVITIDGAADIQEQLGNVTIAWKDIRFPDPFTHHGSLEATVLAQPDGSVRVETNLATQGEAPGMNWDVALRVFAQGESWRQWRGSATLPKLAVQYNDQLVALPGLSMQLSLRDTLVELEKLTVPQQAGLNAQGSLNLTDATWAVQGSLIDLQLEGENLPPISAEFDASGKEAAVTINNLIVRAMDVTATAKGTYNARRSMPLDAQVSMTYVRKLPDTASPPATSAGEAAGAPPAVGATASPTPATAAPPTPPTSVAAEAAGAPPAVGADGAARPALDVAGEFVFDVATTGSLDPLVLVFDGDLLAKQLVTNTGVKIDPVATKVSASLTERAAAFGTARFDMLGAQWVLKGDATFGEEPDGKFIASFTGLALDEVDPILPDHELPSGMLDADVVVHLPRLDTDRARAEGKFSLVNLTDVPIELDRVAGNFKYQGNTIALTGLEVQKEAGMIRGDVTYGMGIEPSLALNVDVQAFPLAVPVGDLKTYLTGKGDLRVNLASVHADGKLSLAGPVLDPAGQQVGRFDLDGRAVKRVWTVVKLDAEFLDAQLKGKGVLNLDELYNSRAEADWENLELEQFVRLYPALEGLGGKTSGTLRLLPADEKNPLEPTRLNMLVRVDDGRFNRLKFDDLTAVAYIGPERVVLDKSSIELANGTLTVWGTYRNRDDNAFVQLDVDARRLDLTELRRAYDPEAAPIAGKLTVTGQAAGPLSGETENDVKRWYGKGVMSISEADLAGSDIVGALYSILSFNLGSGKPEGKGGADLRLEDGQLLVERAHFFNRGVEFGGDFTIADVVKVADSPLTGRAGASLQPLRGLPVPGAKDFSAVLGNLQGDIAAVRVGGTVGEPDVQPASFENLTGGFVEVLFGK